MNTPTKDDNDPDNSYALPTIFSKEVFQMCACIAKNRLFSQSILKHSSVLFIYRMLSRLDGV